MKDVSRARAVAGRAKFAVAVALPLLLAVGGCDKEKKPQAAGRPAQAAQAGPTNWDRMTASIARDLPGRWEAWMGSPADAFYSHMTLEVRPDQTFTLTNVMPDVSRPGSTVENVTDGHWHMEREVAVLDLEHARDGGPIPENKRQLPLVCMADGDMDHMKIDHLIKQGFGGAPFYRPGAAALPTAAPAGRPATGPSAPSSSAAQVPSWLR